jgi:hypothetical protein
LAMSIFLILLYMPFLVLSPVLACTDNTIPTSPSFLHLYHSPAFDLLSPSPLFTP